MAWRKGEGRDRKGETGREEKAKIRGKGERGKGRKKIGRIERRERETYAGSRKREKGRREGGRRRQFIDNVGGEYQIHIFDREQNLYPPKLRGGE